MSLTLEELVALPIEERVRIGREIVERAVREKRGLRIQGFSKYEVIFEVDEHGKIHAHIRNKQTKRKKMGSRTKGGRRTMILLSDTRNGKSKAYPRFVAAAIFDISPNDENWEADHVDHDKTNDSPFNVVPSTKRENVSRSGKRKRGVGNKKRYRPVVAISLYSSRTKHPQDTRIEFESIKAAADTLGLYEPHISNVLNGNRTNAGGWFFERVVFPDLDGEEWKYIEEGSPNMVSNMGRVRENEHGRPNYGHTNDNGYFAVSFKGRPRLVHRLVLRAFKGPPSHKRMCGDHIDGNKKNNHINNLQWLTHVQNIRRAHPNIIVTNLDTNETETFASRSLTAKHFKVSGTAIAGRIKYKSVIKFEGARYSFRKADVNE